MKYLKRFNESLLNDIRSKTDKSLSDIHNKLGISKDHKFCSQCGTKLDRNKKFCSQCGIEQDGHQSANKFTIEGELYLVYTGGNGSYAKTPSLQFSSTNKTLHGTKIELSKFDWMDLSKKLGIKPYYQDKEKSSGVNVSITGTTENGKLPTFKNPIIVDTIEDINKN